MSQQASSIETLLADIRKDRSLSCTDLLSIDDLSIEEIEMIFELAGAAEDFLKGDMKKCSLLKGKSQLNFFMENSTRTRVSFELAGKNLGADTINIAASNSSLTKGESLLDTAITMDQMQPNLIVMRTGASGGVRFFAQNVKASVLNAGDGWNEHPSQALLDLYTMRKYGPKDLTGKKLVIVGDVLHSRVFGSLVRGAQKMGMKIVVTAPHTLIRTNMEQWGVTHEPNIETALEGADVVYSLRLQTERAASAYVPTLREYSKCYVINSQRMKLANKGAIVMHAGPVIRELDVHTNVLESETSVIPYQVFSGYCIRFTLLWLLSEKSQEKTIAKRLYKS